MLAVLCLHDVRAAAGESLAGRFPEETLLYLEAEDVQRALEAFRETGLGRIWHDEDTQDFLAPSLRELDRFIAKIRDESGFDISDLTDSLARRSALGLWTDFQTNIAAILVIEPPDDETGRRLVETLPRVLRRIAPRWRWDEAALDPEGVSRVAFEGGAFSFALHEGALFYAFDATGGVLQTVIWDEGRPRLQDNPTFADAIGKLGRARDLVIFVNLDALWRGIAPMAVEDENLQKVMQVLDSLGLTETRSAAFGLGVEPPGFRTRAFVQAPRPAKGLYSMLAEAPVSEKLLGSVPADAMFLWAARLDLSRLPQIVRDAIREAGIPPEAVDMVMGAAMAVVGFNPETDLVGNLGDEMALVLISPDAVGGIPLLGMNGLCLIVKVKDRKTFGKALVKLIGLGAKYAEESQVGGEIRVKYRGRSVRGVDLAGMIAPSCTLTEEYFVLAPVPSAVELVIDTMEGKSPSILKNASFEEAFRRLDRKGAVAISYAAKPELTGGPAMPMASVGAAGVMAGVLLPALARAGERADLVPDEGEEIAKWFMRAFPLYKLPPLRVVNRNMFPSGSVTRWTEDGLLAEGFGPLPVSVGPSSGGGVATTAVVAAIAIPNMMASKTTDRMSSGSYAVAMLRTYLGAQNMFHRTDFYGKGWLAYANPEDGRGFADLYEVRGTEIKLIDRLFAQATSPASPRAGYYFVDITRDSQGEDYDFTIDCGLCAVPAEYGRSGKLTFVIDVTGMVYQKDTGGQPVTEYPDVEAGGWIPVGAE